MIKHGDDPVFRRSPNMKDKFLAEIRQLRSEGLTYREIGERLGCSSLTVYYRLNPEAKEKYREYQRQYFQRPEVKKRIRGYMRQYFKRPEVKAKMRGYMRKYYQKPEVKRRKRKYYQMPEVPLIDFFTNFNWHSLQEIISFGNCSKRVARMILEAYVDTGLLNKNGEDYQLNSSSPFHKIADGFFDESSKALEENKS